MRHSFLGFVFKVFKVSRSHKTCKNSSETMGVTMAVLVIITIKIDVNY